MKYITVIIFALFFNLFSVVESNSKIVIKDNDILPECPDIEGTNPDAFENIEDLFNFNFELIKSWNNCSGIMMMNGYFSELSKATSKERPHNEEGLVIVVSSFKDGLPSGRAKAYIGRVLFEKDFIELSDEEAEARFMEAFLLPHIYTGYLKEGLPEGEGRLIYTAGFDFFPTTIDGTWKQGCIDWDQKVTFDSSNLAFKIEPSLFSKDHTITVENYDDSTEEEISEEINRYLTECVPGLDRSYSKRYLY